MLKKLTALISAFLMLFISFAVCTAEDYTPPQLTVFLDGEKIGPALSEMFYSFYVPYAAVARKLGYQVAYQADTGEVTAVKGDKTVTVKIGSRIAGIQEGEESIPYTATA